MTGDGGDGTKAAVRVAVAGEPADRQLALLEAEPVAAVEVPSRGPGRPKGSRNRRTEETVAWLKGKYGRGPLELLFERIFADPAELASQLGMKRGDVWAEQNRLAIAALPFVEQKMPVAVDMKTSRTIKVVLTDVDEGEEEGSDGGPVRLLESTEYQALSGAEDGELDAGELDE